MSLQVSDNKELFRVMLVLFWQILKAGSSLKGDSASFSPWNNYNYAQESGIPLSTEIILVSIKHLFATEAVRSSCAVFPVGFISSHFHSLASHCRYFKCSQWSNRTIRLVLQQWKKDNQKRWCCNECLQEVQSICLLHTASAGTDSNGERKQKVSSWKFNKYNSMLLDQNNSRPWQAIRHLKHPLSHPQWERVTSIL